MINLEGHKFHLVDALTLLAQKERERFFACGGSDKELREICTLRDTVQREMG